MQRAAEADNARQQVGHAAGRAEAKGGVRQREFGALSGNSDIAQKGELEAASEGVTLNRGNDRLAQPTHGESEFHVKRYGLGERNGIHSLHRLDVAAGRKSRGGAPRTRARART